MTEAANARAVIQRIRHERHADDPGGLSGDANAQDLATALNMLSDQLYSTPTHFVLEMVQNADDNKYEPDVHPTLTFHYNDESGFLWVGCNEKGFTERDLRAICRIGASTKKLDGTRKGYIGEKGIGFKSVFRVADVVWISSLDYRFRFDKNDTLGMIVPIWSDFECTPPFRASTIFCLRIPDARDRVDVKDMLVNITPGLLLFLRKLVKIETVITGQTTRKCILERKESPRTIGLSLLARTEVLPSGVDRTTQVEIYTTRLTCRDLPFEPKREGVAETEIVLGFPIDGTRHQRYVYNFLPIRGYGFKFLLQADFVLTASRGDIVEGNDWNKHLVSKAIEAFVSAIGKFNTTGICKYKWPGFLSHATSADLGGSLFGNFIDSLRARLKDQPVLKTQSESESSGYSAPSSVVVVPHHFTDGCEPPRPLLDATHHLETYASTKYDATELDFLGVAPQTTADFRNGLRAMGNDGIAAKDPEWHNRLAAGILWAGTSSFKDIDLIPLREGRWISSQQGPFYAPMSQDLEVPARLDVKIVDQAAYENESRRAMFNRFGMLTLSEREICDLIIAFHTQHPMPRQNVHELVYHAWYLFKHCSSIDCSGLWLVSKNHRRHKGSELYMDIPTAAFHMKDYYTGPDAPCTLIHPNYLTKGTSSVEKASWHRWLRDAAGVATLPRLSQTSTFRTTTAISKEFIYLCNEHPSRVWLTLLRDNWAHYQSPALVRQVLSALKNMPVDCQAGRQPLKDCYLPTVAVQREPLASRHVHLIDLPNPDHHGWLQLSVLGLGSSPDLEFFLTILKGLGQSDASSCNKQDLVRIYEGIARHSGEDKNKAKNVFSQQALIQAVHSFCYEWVSLTKCRWKAPTCLLSVVSLKPIFPTLKNFFVRDLGVQDAGPVDVLDELLSMSVSVSPLAPQVKALMMELPPFRRVLGNADVRQRFNRFMGVRLLPVRKSNETTQFRGGRENDWFIADSDRFTKCFDGKIWTLDFEPEQIRRLEPVIEHMGLTCRKLSKHVQEETVVGTAAEKTFHLDLSNKLQAKAKYISLLVPEQRRQSVSRKLSSLQIWSSPELTLRRSVIVDGQHIYGNDESGRVMLTEHGDVVQLYCLSDAASKNALPWGTFVSPKLQELFNIPDNKKSHLISILTAADHAEIEDHLEREGLWTSEIRTAPLPVAQDDGSEHDSDSDAETAAGTPPQESTNYHETSSSLSGTSTNLRFPSTTDSPYTPSRPSKSRTTQGTLRILDEDAIQTAAEHFNVDDVHVVSASTQPSIRTNASPLLRTSTSSLQTPAVQRFGHNPRTPDPNMLNPDALPERNPFNMNEMANALAVGSNTPSRSVTSNPRSIQHDIGYGGELFVYSLLHRNIHMTDSCWTSNMRSRHGLSPFGGHEGQHSDFTISEHDEAMRFTTWLINSGYDKARDWLQTNITYHLEVKTTLGELREPFMMSNNQMGLAHKWHSDPAHVYIIFRVYHLNIDCSFRMYVDPFALMVEGSLVFSAQGGYSIQCP